MVIWLNDRPNLEKIYVSIKKRMKRNEEGYSLTLSKALKDLVKSNGSTHMRLGFNMQSDGSYTFVMQLNDDEVGIPLLNEKDAVRLWFDIADYVVQYEDQDVPLPMDADIKLTLRKNGYLESEPFTAKANA